MHPYEELTGKGDFLGIAPVNFAAYAGLPDLSSSDIALKNCSEPYHQTKLFLYKEASRENFIRQIFNYNTATVLTHATQTAWALSPCFF